MSSQVEMIPIETAAVRKTTLKQRLSIICYLSAVAVAMIGWLTAIGWAVVSVANWLIG
jgi:hypothetical protein